MDVVGADVWSRGWIAVVLRDGSVRRVSSFPDLSSLVTAFGDATIIGLDIPIGLPDPPPRRADDAARTAVGPRRSSVFPALPEPIATLDTYQEALAECRRRYGHGISAQAFALRHRILEAASSDDQRLHEIHPEVSFTSMAGRHLEHPKRSWNGQMERRRLLADHGIRIPDGLDDPAGSVPPDDVLDAAAVAWSANRIARGEAMTLPNDPESGEPVIWF